MNQIQSGYQPVIDEICAMAWSTLTADELVRVAIAYYHFSIQFRESLEEAVSRYPDDEQLRKLRREECDTANLSPWPPIAAVGEKMDHDEFMRRALMLSPIPADTLLSVTQMGEDYLALTRSVDQKVRALSIASYEDGGLEAVFKAILRANVWHTPLLQAFHHFLVKHIDFDSDPADGHGSLAKHLMPDESVRVMWTAFRDLLIAAVPRLAI